MTKFPNLRFSLWIKTNFLSRCLSHFGQPAPPPTGETLGSFQLWLMICTLTFELWDLSCRTLGQTLMAGVTGQSHGNATAAQQKSDLLTAGILLDDRGRGESGSCSSANKTIKEKLTSTGDLMYSCVTWGLYAMQAALYFKLWRGNTDNKTSAFRIRATCFPVTYLCYLLIKFIKAKSCWNTWTQSDLQRLRGSFHRLRVDLAQTQVHCLLS